jgi:phage shock protein A
VTNPTIKISADTSSALSEIAALKTKIEEMNASLAAGSSSKNQYTFSGTKKELDALIAQAEKLTAALREGRRLIRLTIIIIPGLRYTVFEK